MRVPNLPALAAALAVLCARPAFGLVDINSASLEELQTLPGIGPVLSRRIVAGRPYESLDDLLRVKGIGPKVLEKFKDRIIAGEAAAPDAAPVPGAGKAAPNAPPAQEGAAVPAYDTRAFKLLNCYRCKNKFKVSSDLKTGWCPYCGARLAMW